MSEEQMKEWQAMTRRDALIGWAIIIVGAIAFALIFFLVGKLWG